MLWPLFGAILALFLGKSKTSVVGGAILGLIPAIIVGQFMLNSTPKIESTMTASRIVQKAEASCGEKYAQFNIFAANESGVVQQVKLWHSDAQFMVSKDNKYRLLRARTGFASPTDWLLGVRMPSTQYIIEYPESDAVAVLTPITDVKAQDGVGADNTTAVATLNIYPR